MVVCRERPMSEPLLTKTLGDLRNQILAWGLGMGFLLFMTVLVYPSIGPSYENLLNELPQEFQAFWGSDLDIGSFEGYLGAEFFNYTPIALAVFAILAGTSSILGEETQGTLDLLLSQPISRLRLISGKLAGLVIANGLVVMILLAIFFGTLVFMDIDVKIGRTMVAFLLLWPFLTAISFLSVLLSLLLSNRLFAGTVMAVLLVASFILDSLANLESGLEPLRPIYLTTYYQGGNALGSEVSWAYIAGLTGILFVALSLSLWLFLRRDIAVQRSIGIRTRLMALIRPR